MEKEPVLKDLKRVARNTTATLFIGRSLVSAGFIAGATVAPIAGAQLSGSPAWAGIPAAVLQLGAALSAVVIGLVTDRIGRRLGFSLGLGVGLIGAGLAAAAIAAGAFLLFLSGTLLMGVAWATMQLDRFAAAEVNPPQRRGRAISLVVFGGTVGSILGPLLVGPSGRLAVGMGSSELAGPYLATLISLLLASLTLFIFLRPDPRDIGINIAALFPEQMEHHGEPRRPAQIFRTSGGVVAVSAMVAGQLVMVILMGITALHMKDNLHSLTDISVVISAHTFGMFGFSIITGRLTDRWGRGPVIFTGAVILLSAAILAPISVQVYPLAAALFLLGLGWNFCHVGGSSLLADQLTPAERGKTQGANETLIGLATASANISSGLVYAATSYGVISAIGGAVALIPLALGGWWLIRGRRLTGSGLAASRAAGQGD